MRKLALLFPALLLAAAAPPAAAPAMTAEQALGLCEKALDAALEGHDGRAVVADAVKAMPEDQQRAVLAFCGVYMAGAVAMLKHVTTAPPVPAGKAVSI